MPGRGRPEGSAVRQNIINILQYKRLHGYDVYKIYMSLFPKVSQRLIYYHLNKGVQLDEFEVEHVKEEGGDYSWGTTVEKKYYSLGTKAVPKQSERIERFLKIKEIKIE